ncbi:hypothetical protein E1263_38180 [Kribbella antibiotica]|uniref:Galactose mutarotase n=1 Tax=Kribbella antibiotica TaxID=190195 RepID=A0A4R4YN19_9ACTN|nr:hypothetical protein [Kribbella antibiotica]TDD45654.1 hypothetical protein E1263_38180 [Kribbella antibiotica]
MVIIDSADGGRWTSLHLAGREWLWAGPGLLDGPRTGHTTFTDAGGVDECFPTVRGTPDHGGLWNQPWSDSVTYDGTVLTRRFTTGTDSVTVDCHLTAPPGYRFTWAAHALLGCEVGATISAEPSECRLYPEAGPFLDSWPSEAPWVATNWPTLGLDTYGPTDGTAVGAVLTDCPTARIRDRGSELTMTLACPGQPVSTALWRNQGGFPDEAPYRSLGVEPMLGRVFDLAEAGPGDAAVVPATGELAWRLTITARPL